jgi:hypothetical protein
MQSRNRERAPKRMKIICSCQRVLECAPRSLLPRLSRIPLIEGEASFADQRRPAARGALQIIFEAECPFDRRGLVLKMIKELQ